MNLLRAFGLICAAAVVVLILAVIVAGVIFGIAGAFYG